MRLQGQQGAKASISSSNDMVSNQLYAQLCTHCSRQADQTSPVASACIAILSYVQCSSSWSVHLILCAVRQQLVCLSPGNEQTTLQKHAGIHMINQYGEPDALADGALRAWPDLSC